MFALRPRHFLGLTARRTMLRDDLAVQALHDQVEWLLWVPRLGAQDSALHLNSRLGISALANLCQARDLMIFRKDGAKIKQSPHGTSVKLRYRKLKRGQGPNQNSSPNRNPNAN